MKATKTERRILAADAAKKSERKPMTLLTHLALKKIRRARQSAKPCGGCGATISANKQACLTCLLILAGVAVE